MEGHTQAGQWDSDIHTLRNKQQDTCSPTREMWTDCSQLDPDWPRAPHTG